MCKCLQKPSEDGHLTIRRNKSQFWSGIWSDMAIQQCLMRSDKTPGGLINITHNKSAKVTWFLAAHILAQYNDALRTLTGITSSTWLEQHKEISPGYIKKDRQYMMKFLQYLKIYNPFQDECLNQLRNISTG